MHTGLRRCGSSARVREPRGWDWCCRCYRLADTCFSERARQRRTISPSSARLSSTVMEAFVYFASRVCPCLLTSRMKFIPMAAHSRSASHQHSMLGAQLVLLRCDIHRAAGVDCSMSLGLPSCFAHPGVGSQAWCRVPLERVDSPARCYVVRS